MCTQPPATYSKGDRTYLKAVALNIYLRIKQPAAGAFDGTRRGQGKYADILSNHPPFLSSTKRKYKICIANRSMRKTKISQSNGVLQRGPTLYTRDDIPSVTDTNRTQNLWFQDPGSRSRASRVLQHHSPPPSTAAVLSTCSLSKFSPPAFCELAGAQETGG